MPRAPSFGIGIGGRMVAGEALAAMLAAVSAEAEPLQMRFRLRG
jgi:hypothetical protein